jgi:hypothetical protein
MVFGSYWVVLEPKFWEEVGNEQPTSQLYKPGLFEAIEGIQSIFLLKRSQAKFILRQRSF